jgi:hypothetical protein
MIGIVQIVTLGLAVCIVAGRLHVGMNEMVLHLFHVTFPSGMSWEASFSPLCSSD